MDFISEEVKQACQGHVGFEYNKIKTGDVHYIYWSTDIHEYVAAFSDIVSAMSGTYDIRVFRIWQREREQRTPQSSSWKLVANDFMFGSSEEYPIAMFVDVIEDYDEIDCAFPMNEWHFNTLIGNFNK